MLKFFSVLSFVRWVVGVWCVVWGLNSHGQCPRTASKDTICEGEVARFAITDAAPNSTITWYYGPSTTQRLVETGPQVSVANLDATMSLWADVRTPGCPVTSRIRVTTTMIKKARRPSDTCVDPGMSGIIAKWDLDGNGLDGSGNNNHMLPTRGPVTWTVDRFGQPGKALRLNGTNELSAPSSASLRSTTTTLTVAGWTKIYSWASNFQGTLQSGFVSNGSETVNTHTNFMYRLLVTDTDLIGTSAGWQMGLGAPARWDLQRWYHIAMTIEPGYFRYYINGELRAVVLNNTSLSPTTNRWTIGYDVTGTIKPANADFDDIAIYNRRLSDQEIRSLAQDCGTPQVNTVFTCIAGMSSGSIKFPQRQKLYQFVDSVTNDVLWEGISPNGDSLSGTWMPRNLTKLRLQVVENGCTTIVGTYSAPLTIGNFSAGPPQRLCLNNSITIGAAATPGLRYAWRQVGGLSDTTLAQPTFRPLQTGVYRLPLTVTSIASGCQASDTVTITVDSLPVLARTTTVATICQGEALPIGQVNPRVYTYNWQPADHLAGISASNPVFSYPNRLTRDSLFTYVLRATTGQSCEARDTVRILVRVRPDARQAAGPPQRFCLNNVITVGAAATPGLRYAWRQVGGLSDTTLAQPTFRPLQSGVYRLPLTVTSIASGCQASDTVTITVDSLPVLARTTTLATICQGEALQIGQVNPRVYAYNWQPADHLAGASPSNPVFTYPNRLTRDSLFTYVLRATTGQSCLATDTVMILVLARPDARTATGAILCANAQDLVGIPGAGTTAGFSYRWTGMGLPALNSDTVARPNFRASFIPGISNLRGDTTFRLLLSVTRRATGCQDTQSVIVVVRPTPPLLTGPNLVVCEGEQGTLGLFEPGYTRSWSVANGLGSLDNNRAAQPRFQAPSNITKDTTTSLTLQVMSTLTGCIRFDSVSVSINQRPRLRPQPSDVTPLLICAGEAGSLTASPESPISILTYQWLQGSMVVANGPILNLTNTNTGTTATTERYTLVTNRLNGGCEVRQEAVVRLLAPVTTSLAHNNSWLCPEQLTGKVYSARPALPGQSYAWQVTGGDIIRQDSNAVVVNWQEGAGRYEVAVTTTSAEGCRTTLARLEVQLDATVSDPNSGCNLDDYPLMVPNVITPNSDGVNDEFGIKNLAFYPNLSLQVFNRFGVQVYKADNYRNTWNADGLPAGTYFIVLNTGRGKTVKGFVEVVK